MFIERNRSKFRITKMADVLKVSRSGYYTWHNRWPSDREMDNQELKKRIRQIHEDNNKVPGSPKITVEINKDSEKPVNHKRVERIMHENGIQSKIKKKYKATTNSNHNLPVAENILNRDFEASEPCRKMVSDITYIPTDEGWLYAAAVMDLCGDKVIGLSMDSRMTKELATNALQDAIRHSACTEGCFLHSDRGSQYCSAAYQEPAKEHGFISSMSCKGNCWDNAPMESFWGKLKQEWLNDQHFKTRGAKSSAFEYIWIYYNRKRLHTSFGYTTPEKYYRDHSRELKAA